ncbi:hypothetical protein BCR37DRAFT_376274 [Protomyces lactucae-debilis]|uniref:Xrn1 N-terminal domain-containing protein n=1 Tax=Protomyces lactucae-debilis TaxID=2754530 RepID=A0A1Y2FSH6_PROLT|nr:uncharacterized protein BCR37DRAFT_376274 [Protomyces lactucae-debilis]ORY86943.1 hypothetical protein BCR37DRAFT_376274 [Protomyces lactucae-debilis]
MGIKEKGFADWVIGQFPDSAHTLSSTDAAPFSHVLIDMNPLIHTNLRTAKDEKQCIKRLFAELDRLLRLTQPQVLVYLAVDGAPPLAKMKEQIRRRRSRAPSKEKRKLDSSQITPGCAFMMRMTAYLQYYAARYLASYKNRSGKLRFIIDGAETEGEGEAKIMAFLATQANMIAGDVAVYSGDSDVVIQSLLSPIAGLFVVRYSPDQIVALSMRVLRTLIAMPLPAAESFTTYRHLVDFVFLVLFSGNDYLQKLRGAKISKTWPIYKAFRAEAAWQGRHLISESFADFDHEVLVELLQRVRLNGRKAKGPKGKSRLFTPNLRVAVAEVEDDTSDAAEEDDEQDLDDAFTEFDRAAAGMNPEFVQSLAPFKRESEAVLRSDTYTTHLPDYFHSLFWCLRVCQHGRCPDYLFLPQRSILTIEQVLTFIARDLPRSPFSLKLDAHPPLPSVAIACALLGKHKAALLPATWQSLFEQDTLRELLFLMLFHPLTSNAQRRRLAHLVRSQIPATSGRRHAGLFDTARQLSCWPQTMPHPTSFQDPLATARHAAASSGLSQIWHGGAADAFTALPPTVGRLVYMDGWQTSDLVDVAAVSQVWRKMPRIQQERGDAFRMFRRQTGVLQPRGIQSGVKVMKRER